MAIHAMALKVQLWHAQHAFAWVDRHAKVAEAFKDQAQVMEMFISAGAGDENVINIRIGEMQTSQDVVHESLKGLGRISKAEGYSCEFEQAERGGNCCLRDVVWLHRNLMVRSDKVELGENGCSVQCCCKILDMRDGISIRNGGIVQRKIIPARSPVSWGLFRDHVER